MSDTIQSRLKGQAVKVTFPDGQERLVVEIALDCPECGQHTIRLAGHHLRAIRNLLIEFIDLHPTLCGDEHTLKVLRRETFGGTAPADPSTN